MITGLELTFMGLTRCNCGLFSSPGFIAHLWEKEKEGKNGRGEVGEEGIEEEWKEVRKKE